MLGGFSLWVYNTGLFFQRGFSVSMVCRHRGWQRAGFLLPLCRWVRISTRRWQTRRLVTLRLVDRQQRSRMSGIACGRSEPQVPRRAVAKRHGGLKRFIGEYPKRFCSSWTTRQSCQPVKQAGSPPLKSRGTKTHVRSAGLLKIAYNVGVKIYGAVTMSH